MCQIHAGKNIIYCMKNNNNNKKLAKEKKTNYKY